MDTSAISVVDDIDLQYRHCGVDTGDGQEKGEDDEEETVFGEIGESGDKHGKDEGDGPGRNGEAES